MVTTLPNADYPKLAFQMHWPQAFEFHKVFEFHWGFLIGFLRLYFYHLLSNAYATVFHALPVLGKTRLAQGVVRCENFAMLRNPPPHQLWRSITH
jgi:hypothetical protein